jgi:hypothetical protein
LHDFQEQAGERHAASTRALRDSIISASHTEYMFPEIFDFKQRVVMHLGDQPYHPANRRVSLRVQIEDLIVRYGLSEDAADFVLRVSFFVTNPDDFENSLNV